VPPPSPTWSFPAQFSSEHCNTHAHSHVSYNGDVCAELAKAGHPCPLNAGPQTIVASLATSGAPSGTFSVQATAKTSDGKQIMCTDFKFQINSNNQVSSALACVSVLFDRTHSLYLQIVASSPIAAAAALQLALGAADHPIECVHCSTRLTPSMPRHLLQTAPVTASAAGVRPASSPSTSFRSFLRTAPP
jgi:hypothetical protein